MWGFTVRLFTSFWELGEKRDMSKWRVVTLGFKTRTRGEQ